jgi:hypothetical protein
MHLSTSQGHCHKKIALDPDSAIGGTATLDSMTNQASNVGYHTMLSQETQNS